jgi:hypothetical protein
MFSGYLESWTVDKVQECSDSVTPLSEPVTFYSGSVFCDRWILTGLYRDPLYTRSRECTVWGTD